MKNDLKFEKDQVVSLGKVHDCRKIVCVLRIAVIIFVLSLLQVLSLNLFAQSVKSVNGRVSDTDGNALFGVTVSVKGTTNGTMTDDEGKYNLQNVPSDATLVYFYIGMKTQEVSASGRTQIDIKLEEDAIGLEEVTVVVGYGVQKKVNLTGSVSTVQSKELVKVPSANVSEVLTGKAPGLFAKQGQGVPGEDDATLSIRGYNAPLVLVDGVETSWSRMDPNEIESVSVLKDAAAAVYGARAGNGVILITTKRGTTEKTSITYSGNISFQSPTTVPKFVSSAKYVELVREGQFNYGMDYTYTEEDLEKYKAGNDPDYVNEDWYKAAFRKWSPMHSHNLAVRGGTDKIKYYMGIGYLDQQGTYKSDDLNFHRYNVRSNIDAQISNRFSVSLDLSYRNEISKAPQTSLDNIWINLKTALPVWSASLPDPSMGSAYSGFLERSPVGQTYSDITGSNYRGQRFFNGKISFKYKIPGIEGLEANASFNYAVNSIFTKVQDKPFNVYSYNHQSDEYTFWGINGSNSLNESASRYTQLYPLVSLNYNNTFGDHAVQGLLLAEGIDTDYNIIKAGRVDLLSPDLPFLFAGSPDNITNDGRTIETGRISYVGRANYSYKGKYLLEGAFRYDASHKFPKNSRWGFFPSISAGWRLSEESFIKNNVSWIENMKLRASYSKSGDDNVEAFKYLTGYQIMRPKNDLYIFGDEAYRLIRTTGLSNPNITWLEMNNYNIGLDASFLNGLIGFEFDWFYRLTDGIFGKPLDSYPSTFGGELPMININSTTDRGFELTMTHRNKIGKDFNYFVSGSVSLARQKYKYWAESPYNDEDEIRVYKKTGKYVNRWVGYKSDGLFMSQEEIDNHPVDQDEAGNTTLRPGDIKYVDRNGDKVIDWRDQDEIGYDEFPDLTYGFNFDIQYKGFTLSALFQGASMFNSMVNDLVRNPLMNGGNAYDFHYKYRWQPDPDNKDVNINPDVRLPAINSQGTSNNNNKASDFWLKDATYLRLKNLNLGYNLPGPFVKRMGLQNVNIYVAGSNLFTLSKLGIYKKSIDPEATGYQKFYPPVKTISFGLNITM